MQKEMNSQTKTADKQKLWEPKIIEVLKDSIIKQIINLRPLTASKYKAQQHQDKLRQILFKLSNNFKE
jgi:hypothetical protein